MDWLALPTAVLAQIRAYVVDDGALLDVLAELELQRLCSDDSAADRLNSGGGSNHHLVSARNLPVLSVVVPQPQFDVSAYLAALALDFSAGRCVVVDCCFGSSGTGVVANVETPSAGGGRTLAIASDTAVDAEEAIWREEPIIAVAGTTEEYLLPSERDRCVAKFRDSVAAHIAALDREEAVLLSSGCGVLPSESAKRRQTLKKRHLNVVGACDHCLAACYAAQGIDLHELDAGDNQEVLSCKHCGVVYCSVSCQENAWQVYHQVECMLRRDGAAIKIALQETEAGRGGGKENMARPLVWRMLCAAFCEQFGLAPKPSLARNVDKHLQICSYTIGNIRSQLFIGAEEREAIASGLHQASRVPLPEVRGFYWLSEGVYRLIGATLTNRFAVATHVDDEDIDDGLLPIVRGVATFALARFMNHACPPSCTAAGSTNFTSARMTFAAARPLCGGTELTWPYDLGRDPITRILHLYTFYGFVCQCEQCTAT